MSEEEAAEAKEDLYCPHSKVTKKESLIDTVAQEGIELEASLKELGISRKKGVNSQSKKVQKSQTMRLITGLGGNKKRGTDGETRVVLPKAIGVDFVDVSESTTSSKLAQAFPKKSMLKSGSTSGTTGSGEASEDRLGKEDELKVVEDRGKFAVRNGCSFDEGDLLRVEEEKAELEKEKAELEKKVVHLKTNLAREGSDWTPWRLPKRQRSAS
ncbi:hypothetical protein GIB67_025824 [Kingdonia uniflora]|uniref:Uncharacterized protein n=1 Tax=Kingdonia uniflora TaxID=39325 RepID=A0A7J7MC78_9MAGN|nr:hypothetical protein GIB67_025824 [Kingdonia uniflora]